MVWQTSASFRQGVDSLMKLGTTTSTTVKVKQQRHLGHQRRKSFLYLLDGSELLHDSAQPQQSVTSRPGACNLTGLVCACSVGSHEHRTLPQPSR